MEKKRRINKSIAEETLQIMKQGYFHNSLKEKIDISKSLELAIDGTVCYSPEMSDALLVKSWEENSDSKLEVTNESTFDSVRRLINEGEENVMCLNFASARNPGGGFLGGSQAQEESLARASGLYPTLTKCEEYYQTNRKMKSCFYTDYMIYSPKVPMFKKENGDNLDQALSVSIITAPAVNTGVVQQREPDRIDEIEIVMKRRIEKVLAISANHGHKVLVLGAWGCGVFRNDPEKMAVYFKEVIDSNFKNHFQKLVFAIYSKNERFINPFIKQFK
jgi:uncharacterized protein (TIGR02452 family)